MSALEIGTQRAARWLTLMAASLLWQGPALAETRLDAVQLGSGAYAIAINPVTNKAYVGNGLGVSIIDGATHALTTVAPGASGPMAVNTATNTIYVTTYFTNTVTVIDGATQAVTTLAVAANPGAIAVNAVTNEIYVAHENGALVTVIDGATHAQSTVSVGTTPVAIVVNPVTNKVYVANRGSDNVTVIDAATKATTTIATGGSPVALAVNSSTNKVYAANVGTVAEIDGATHAVTSIPSGAAATSIAVNSTTNRIYVTNAGSPACCGPSGDVKVIDGATRAVTAVGAGVFRNPSKLAVNPLTDTVYVTFDQGVGLPVPIGVIDGATNLVRTLGGTFGFQSDVAVNPVTNRIYVSQAFVSSVTVFDGTNRTSATIPTGTSPSALATNAALDKAYVANSGSNTVTVIDELAGTTTNVGVGTAPAAMAVDSATHRVYVANRGSNTVTVIEGGTNATSTVAVGSAPTALAVNPLAGRIYVANRDGNSVTAIEAGTGSTTTVAVGTAPVDVAVNPVTSRVYVANSGSANVTVIDGAGAVVANVPVALEPSAIAINPVNNTIFVANRGSGSVTAIDGATHATRTVLAGASPRALVVDPVNDKLFVANFGSNTVSIVDGAGDAGQIVAVGNGPRALALNPVTHEVHVANEDGTVSTIAGRFNVMTSVATASAAGAIAVNPASDRIYVTHPGANEVVALTRPATPNGIAVAMAGGTVTRQASPTVTLAPCCVAAPAGGGSRQVYYRSVDGQGAFTQAGGTGPYTATLEGLKPGLNFVTFVAVDSVEGSSLTSRAVASATVSAQEVFPVTVIAPAFTTAAALPPATTGSPYAASLVAQAASAVSFAVTGGALPAGVALATNGTISGTPTESGFFTFTVTATDAGGGSASRLFGLTSTGSSTPRSTNISTRMGIATGENVLIGGFVIGGSVAKTVVVRARGPSLAPFGVANVLPNPTLRLVRSSDQATLANNDDWADAANAAAVAASGFAPSAPLESAVLVTLPPGAYTAVVADTNARSGVGIVEVFEVDRPEAALTNISTRGQVLTGESVMIGGFVVQGSGPQRVVIRARGPSLGAFGVANPLADPTLQVVRSSDRVILADNNDWGSAGNAAEITASGFAPGNALESAVLLTLDPGAYTAIVAGVGGSTGVALVEVFALP